MRAWFYKIALLFALLFASAAGQRLSAPPQRQGVSPLPASQRQAVIARGSLQTLALATAGRQTRRGHGAPQVAYVLPLQPWLMVLSGRPIELQRADNLPPIAQSLRLHGPRAPPVSLAASA